MMKKISSILTVIFLMIAACVTVSAKTENTDVFDQAGLFSQTEALQNSVSELKEATGWNVAIVTTDDADGKSSMVYADDFYDQLFGINTDGILYLIDMDNRENYISTSGEAILYIDDYRIERILDETTPNLSDGDYDQAAIDFIQTVAKYYADGIPESNADYTIDADGNYEKKREFPLGFAALAGVIAAVIGVATVLIRYKTHSSPGASIYMDSRETRFRDKRDMYLREYTRSVDISSSSSGGGGGGSSTHTSSSGGTHGGGGRGF